MYKVNNGQLEFKRGSIKEGLLAVASGKGGVGKSTVTVNLAAALKKAGKKVGIIDADIHGFSIPRIIGLEDEPLAKSKDEIIPPESRGIKVMSMGSFVKEEDPVIWRGPLLLGALKQFLEDVNWGEMDYLLLDLPPGTGDMALNIMQQLPHSEILIVTTPQPTAVNVAGRIAGAADKLNVSLAGVIENMSYYKCPQCGHEESIFGQGGGRELADRLGTKLLGELPLMPIVRQRSDEGRPVVSSEPELEVSKEYNRIAEKIIDNRSNFDPNIKPMNLNQN